jgi:ABC-type uncharacterized transport system permease subunit
MGLFVGLPVIGLEEGLIVGFVVGILAGFTVGNIISGIIVGFVVGLLVGCIIGLLVGFAVRFIVGFISGIIVGFLFFDMPIPYMEAVLSSRKRESRVPIHFTEFVVCSLACTPRSNSTMVVAKASSLVDMRPMIMVPIGKLTGIGG